VSGHLESRHEEFGTAIINPGYPLASICRWVRAVDKCRRIRLGASAEYGQRRDGGP
jgi:hypothetical protein